MHKDFGLIYYGRYAPNGWSDRFIYSDFPRVTHEIRENGFKHILHTGRKIIVAVYFYFYLNIMDIFAESQKVFLYSFRLG